MKGQIGARIGAIFGGNENEVKWFGYGVYEGDFVPGPEAQGWMAEALRDQGLDNPRLRLDTGEVVYGCECWWGLEEAVKAQIASYEEAGAKITLVSRSDIVAGA